jgi:hypothetical protein
MVMARSGSQRLVCRIAWMAQRVSGLWRRPRAALARCEGARMVRNGNAQRRFAHGIGSITASDSQRRPEVLTKKPREERTGSR